MTLTDALISNGKLTKDATVMYVSSEMIRGVPILGIDQHPSVSF